MKNKILYERSLRTCIIMLVVCIVFKLFGAEWFDLNTSIPILQKLDKIISDNLILSFVFTLIFKVFNGVLIYSLMSKDIKLVLHHIHWIIIATVVSMLLCYMGIDNLLFDVIALYTVGKTVLGTDDLEMGAVILVDTVYQIISLFIRSLSIGFVYYGFIENILLLLDYYILLIITYLYLYKGGYTLCGEIRRFCSFLATKLWKKRSKNYSENKGDN